MVASETGVSDETGTSPTGGLHRADTRPGGRRQLRRRLLWVAVAAALVVTVVIGLLSSREDVSRPVSGTDTTTSPTPAWLSGASGEGVADGSFAAWRGSPLGIAGTWADNNQGMVELPQLQPGGEFGAWQGSLDIAIGAFGKGESWAAAARGDYDDRWRESLTNLRDLWGDRPGTVYIRFAHEMNGNWYPWAVNADNASPFKAAWQRFRALQQEIFPASQLVFCVNRESVGSGIDWRQTFPGAQYVDVLGVDYYNNNPAVYSQEQFDQAATATDSRGAPKGIQRHLEFAKSVGLPLAVPEWSGNAGDAGDQPSWITAMHAFFEQHAGTGAGQVLYDVLFNVEGYDGDFLLFGNTRMPESAATYQRLW